MPDARRCGRPARRSVPPTAAGPAAATSRTTTVPDPAADPTARSRRRRPGAARSATPARPRHAPGRRRWPSHRGRASTAARYAAPAWHHAHRSGPSTTPGWRQRPRWCDERSARPLRPRRSHPRPARPGRHVRPGARGPARRAPGGAAARLDRHRRPELVRDLPASGRAGVVRRHRPPGPRAGAADRAAVRARGGRRRHRGGARRPGLGPGDGGRLLHGRTDRAAPGPPPPRPGRRVGDGGDGRLVPDHPAQPAAVVGPAAHRRRPALRRRAPRRAQAGDGGGRHGRGRGRLAGPADRRGEAGHGGGPASARAGRCAATTPAGSPPTWRCRPPRW